MGPTAHSGTSHVDRWWAAAAGLLAFGVYVSTLAPGMVAVLDTPMFQFVGRVLGVPHNPGYPFYVLVTHLFSYLPVGSLAYRINLFSAICGAVAVALVFLIARRLGCRRVISLSAALGMAFAHVFWSQSIVAEVYTLDAALVAGILLATLVWGDTGRPWLFYTAVGLLAAGLGNHTTIVAFLPGVVGFAWLVQRAFITDPRRLAVTAGILLAGLAQYGLILLRTRVPGAYVESPATTLAELIRVMSGHQFSDRLFAFGWREVLFERVPWLVGQALVPELTMAGVVLALVGAVSLVRTSLARAVLLLSGGVAVLVFALNYSVIDLPVFLIPATLVAWVLMAAGGECVARTVRRVPGAAVVLGLALMAVPAWHLARNYAITDRSHDRRAMVTFDRLFETLPTRAAIVREDFVVDRMVSYKVLGDPPPHAPRVVLVDRAADAVRARLSRRDAVFAFAKAAQQLRFDALGFAFAPLELLDDGLRALLGRLPAGMTVAVGVPGALADDFLASGAASLDAIGSLHQRLARGTGALTVVGATGAREGAIVARELDACAAFDERQAIGTTGVNAPVSFQIETSAAEAAIRQGGRDIVRSGEGGVLAVWRADGQLERVVVLQADQQFRPPVLHGPLSVYPLRGEWSSTQIADAWTQAASLADTGSILLRTPARSRVVLYVAADAPLAPRVLDRSHADIEVSVSQGTPMDLPSVPDGAPLPADAHVYRIDIRAPVDGLAATMIALGGVPRDLIARVEDGDAATIASVDTTGLLRTPDDASEVLLMARDEQQQLVGAGWSPVDWDAVSPFRWTIERRAHLLLPVARAGAERLSLQAFRRASAGSSRLRVLLNGLDLGEREVREGWHRYEWSIPDGGVHDGTNSMVLVVDEPSDEEAGREAVRGLAVSEVRLVTGASSAPALSSCD